MCGLAGILDWRQPPVPAALQTMIDSLAHRGPDGQGIRIDGPVGLAHSRLSIIDLAGGAQPMGNEDGQIQVVFNGEIFNHEELREALLARGHRFATRADTEVIVHLYEDHGLDFVQHLNGQFAIALWDARRQRLVLARDRAGIRPLFYTQQGTRWLFASEVKALFTQPEVPRALNLRALNEVFSCWAPLGDHSVFEGIHSLPPGHLMVISEQASTSHPYWDWHFPDAATAASRHPATHEASAEELARELRHRMAQSVRLQLRADVPVGAYLSGGLDSSIIACLVHEQVPEQLRTFSLCFEEAEFDESAHQQTLARHFGLKHSSVVCRKADIARLFPKTIWHTESPTVRAAPAPMMMLAQHARASGYKVVLTGEGADEVFAGYDLFREARVRRFMARQPASRWRPQLIDRLYPHMARSPTTAKALARQFFAQGAEHLGHPGFGHYPRWVTTQRTAQLYSAATREAVGDWPALGALANGLPEDFPRWAPLHQDQYIEAHTLMAGYLLSSQGDRMAMAASIEGRFPFLDHELIEWANTLPPRYKLMGLQEKYLLKQAFARDLPREILARDKQPYRAPDSASFFENGQPVDYVADLLAPDAITRAGYFEPQAIQRLLSKCQSGRAIGFGDNMAFMGVLSTMLLHHQFIAPAT